MRRPKKLEGIRSLQLSLLQDILKNVSSIAQKLCGLIRKCDNAIKTLEGTNQVNQRLAKTPRKVDFGTMVNVVILIASLTILYIALRQFSITKAYQDWTRKEMARKPRLSLVVTDSVRIKDDTIRFSCSLINKGDDIAKAVQIRFPVNDTTDSINPVTKIRGQDAVIFGGKGDLTIKLPIYERSDFIYFHDDTTNPYIIMLPWIWEVSNIRKINRMKPSVYIMTYYVDSDRGSRMESLIVNIPPHSFK